MKLSDPGFPPEQVLTHPRHQAAQKTLAELIEQLRACEGPADGYAFQRELLEHVLAAESKRNACSQAVKLLRKGRQIPVAAPQIESSMDPAQLGSWVFEREMWERIARQYRSIGDAMAWRAFGFRREFILALSRSEPAGVMAGKAGLAAELERVESAWADGSFALLHDLTNCLRIGDVTVFGPDDVPVTEEIKTNPRRHDPAQLRRIQAAREAVWHNAVLPGDDPRQKLYDLAIPYKTHLDLLRATAEQAASEGIAAAAVPGSRAVVVVDQYGLMNAGITEETFPERFDALYEPVRRRAGLDVRRALNIGATSLDSTARNPRRAPWAIYPLHPVLCARLIGDIAVFMVETHGPALAQQLQAVGIPARWTCRSGSSGELMPGEVVMEMTTVRRTPLGTGILEDKRVLQMQQAELDRYLIELADPVIWSAGIRHLVENRQAPDRPWPHYRNEHLVWD